MKQSPYFNINYGWPYGADGWNSGMDENLLILSFLSKHEVLSIVGSVPDASVEGDAYVVSSDNSARFLVEGTWRITYPSDGWEFITRQDGRKWRYENGIPTEMVNPDNLLETVNTLDDRVGNIDTQLSTINESLDELSDIPTRVGVLENESASEEDLQSLVVRVDSLEDQGASLTQRLDDVDLDLGEVQESVVSIQAQIDVKLENILPGTGISVDSTDPLNPTVSLDVSVLSDVAVSGSYNDLDDLPTLGSAAAADTTAFDSAGSATQALSDANTYTDNAVSGVEDALTLVIDERMSSSARAAVDALDASTATLEDLILALQST